MVSKNILFLASGASVVAITATVIGFKLLNPSTSNPLTQTLNQVINKEPRVGEDICGEFPKEFVESATGQTITKTKPFSWDTIRNCEYYFDDDNFVSLATDNLNVEKQKQGHVALGRTATQDASIKMENWVIWQGDGPINEIYLVLNPNRFLSINRSSLKYLNNDQTIALAALVAERITRGENVAVPLPEAKKVEATAEASELAVINTFTNLLSQRKIDQAVNMLSPQMIADDANKQAWGVQYNAFTSFKLDEAVPSSASDWTENIHTYQIKATVTMSPESADGPIPYYGWENGQNIRWLTLEKVDGTWKVQGFATGP